MIWETAVGPLDIVHTASKGLNAGWVAIQSGGWLTGLTVANEDPANPCTVDFYDGNGANSDYLFTVRLAANATTRQSPGLPGVPISAGVFVNVTAGAADVAITLGQKP